MDDNFMFEKYSQQSSNTFRFFDMDAKSHEEVLEEFQIAQNSGYGDILSHSGGFIVNNTVRVFGMSQNRRSVSSWNKKAKVIGLDNAFIIADDIFGGQFAFVNGVSDSNGKHIFYLAPDTLKWDELGMNFLNFLLIGDLEGFYGYYYERMGKIKSNEVDFDSAVSFYPMPFTNEFESSKASAKIISAEEVYKLYTEFQQQLL